MMEKEFMNKVARGKDDFLQKFIDILEKENISYCIVGGLAVNAYAEPVVSLDLDVVVVAEKLNNLVSVLRELFSVGEYPNSINISESTSDLRIQIQTDPRYQPFIDRAVSKTVLGYDVFVAEVKDVLRGKIWAAMDETRRPSKRQKDLADIMRLIEKDPTLVSLLPEDLRKRLYPDE